MHIRPSTLTLCERTERHDALFARATRLLLQWTTMHVGWRAEVLTLMGSAAEKSRQRSLGGPVDEPADHA
jgi:hypothetical protein